MSPAAVNNNRATTMLKMLATMLIHLAIRIKAKKEKKKRDLKEKQEERKKEKKRRRGRKRRGLSWVGGR